MKKKKIFSFAVIFLMIFQVIFTINSLTNGTRSAGEERFNYIIITRKYLENSVQELIKWRESQGFKVKIITNLQNPDEIRDFLKSKYLEWGIEYLLIVGSNNTIPMKECYIDKDQNEKEEYIPTDHYYAELTHNWDADNDGYFGEFNDDIKNNTDLLPEISVGRLPFDNPENVKEFCKKLINYEKNTGDWKRKALFLAGIQNYIPEINDGAFYTEKIQNEILINSGFDCTKLYETRGLNPTNYSYDLPLNHINTLKKLREGYGLVIINGKGMPRFSRGYVWVKDNGNGIPDQDEIKLSLKYIFIHSFDKFFLKTDKPSIVYSYTCYTAANSKPPSTLLPFQPITIQLNLCSSLLDSVAIVFIGPTIGNRGGGQLEYNFTKYFSSNSLRLGDAFFKAKIDYINSDGGLDQPFYYYSAKSIRWTTLVTNFYGDPATLTNLPN